jgi:hypothetical protein
MMFTDLRPNEFDWIEFRSISWKVKDVQAMAMFSNKLLSLRADMNFMVIPDQNNLTWDETEPMAQKGNRMDGAETALIRTNSQSHAPHTRTDQKCAEQIQALMMV